MPLAGGKVYTYAAGTSTPLATYTDAGGLTPNANPTILDASGQAAIWLGPLAYKISLYSALDVLQPGFPVDNLVQQAVWPVASVTLPSVNGPTLTAAFAGLAGARVLTVGTKILTGLGTSGGLTSFAVGDGGLVDRWGISAALTTGSLTGTSDSPAAAQAHDSSLALYPTGLTVVLTALDGLFDGTGSVQVSPQYLMTPYRAA